MAVQIEYLITTLHITRGKYEDSRPTLRLLKLFFFSLVPDVVIGDLDSARPDVLSAFESKVGFFSLDLS
jgi:hypothetical protein